MYKANTTNKKLRARGQYYWSYFPFVILNGFCIDCFSVYLKELSMEFYQICFSVYLKELSMEFYQILQTHSYVHGKYY